MRAESGGSTWAGLSGRVRAAFGALRGLLETRCVVCLAPMRPPESGPDSDEHPEARLCPECARDMALRRTDCCPGCGAMFEPLGRAPGLCGDCLREPPPWEGCAVRAPYAGHLKEAVARLKFGRELELTDALGRLLAEACRERIAFAPDVILAAPMHPARLVERGFNQSVELARRVAALQNARLAPAGLVKTRDVPPQAGLARARRLVNVKGAIAADPDVVAGRSVLIVDDVMTTGATLRECALAARRAGAVRVAVAALARA